MGWLPLALMRERSPVLRALRLDKSKGRTDSCARFHAGSGSIASRNIAETYSVKLEAEAHFNSVALMWSSHESNIVSACKAVVAATETANTSTQDNRYRPVVGGTVYNAARGAGTYGWETVLWSGADTVDIPAASGISGQKAVVSDFMSVGSVARSDGGTRPLLLFRAYHDGAVNGNHSYESRDFAPWRTESAANRGRFLDVGNYTGDAISTLSNAIVVGTKIPLISPIFRYASNVISVAAFGDSITQGSGATFSLDSWIRRACFDLSTVDSPVIPSNFGFASQSSVTYLAVSKIYIPLVRPTVAFYAPYSPNDGTHNQRLVIEQLSRAAEFVKLCQDNNVIPVLLTPVPNGNVSEASDQYRRAVSDAIVDFGRSSGVIVADFRTATSVKGTPDIWITGFNADAIHPSESGQEAITTIAKDAIVRATLTF